MNEPRTSRANSGAPTLPTTTTRFVSSRSGSRIDTPTGRGAYDGFADKVGLVPNVRAKDNLFQGVFVAVTTILGAAVLGCSVDGRWVSSAKLWWVCCSVAA